MNPKRIQRKRTRGWKMPPNTVYVGRPGKWGNPFVIGHFSHSMWTEICPGVVKDAAHAVALYEQWLKTDTAEFIRNAAKNELRGKTLACWCREGEPCHADVLLEIANEVGE